MMETKKHDELCEAPGPCRCELRAKLLSRVALLRTSLLKPMWLFMNNTRLLSGARSVGAVNHKGKPFTKDWRRAKLRMAVQAAVEIEELVSEWVIVAGADALGRPRPPFGIGNAAARAPENDATGSAGSGS
jgi:hypothetical protein